MKKTFYLTPLLLILVASWGCSVNTKSQLLADGQTPLDKDSLYDLVAGNTLHLTAIDFDASVYFEENGTMAALSLEQEKDSGNWDITTDDLVCLDFKVWYFGDHKCYSVFYQQSDDSYIFFTSNGARYYTANQMSETPKGLLSDGKKEKSVSYLAQKRGQNPDSTSSTNSSPPTPAPEPSESEMKHLMSTTAKECPACNLSGVDLSKTDLIAANLAGANLSGANFYGANLRRANLAGANLQGANLKAANLPGADLTNCNLKNADFTGANLIKANLSGSTTSGIILQDALLEGTKGIK